MFYKSIYDIEWKYYDLLYGDYSEDIAFYNNIVKNDVLELMCGTGRISSKLKNANTIGIDNDDRMLKEAEKKKLNCIKQDVKSFHLDKKFDYVLIPLNSLLLFERDDKEKILKLSREHLKENGKIIVDIIPPLDFEESMVYLGDHRISENLEIWRFFVPNFSDDMMVLNLTYFYDIYENSTYRRDSAVLVLYLENFETMKEIIKNSGLKIDNVYGSYNMKKFVPEESAKMIFILKK